MAVSRWGFALGALLSIQTCLLLVNGWRLGPGWDEWGHLPSGLYSLQYGDFDPYCVNPPLVRLAAAFPVLLAGGGIDFTPLPTVPGFRSEGLLAVNYIDQHGERVFVWVSMARTALIPLSWLGTWLIWSIGRRYYGNLSGLIAAGLWSFSPTVLTFGASITPDVSAAVFGLLTAWRFYIWLRLGTIRNAVCLAGSLALAILSKTTWIVFLPILVIVTTVSACRNRQRWNGPARWRQVVIVAGLTFLAIAGCYDFQGMLRPLGQFQFISGTLNGIGTDARDSLAVGNRFRDTPWEHLPMPLPASMIRGIDIQKSDFEAGYASYLLGQWQQHGWWYYYLVAIFVKEPIAFWILTLLTTGVRWGMTGWGITRWGITRWGKKRRSWSGEWIVMLPGFVVLLLVSSQTGFNHHLRYVLPFYPCMYLLAARSVSGLPSRLQRWSVALVVWYAVSSISVIPYSYAFFSEAVGGPTEGWRYLGDSNLDWGQDLPATRRWIEANPDLRPVYLLYSIPMDNFRKLGIDADDGRDDVSGDGPNKPGYWIVFARTMLEEPYRWFRDHDPTFDISVTTKVFVIPPETENP